MSVCVFVSWQVITRISRHEKLVAAADVTFRKEDRKEEEEEEKIKKSLSLCLSRKHVLLAAAVTLIIYNTVCKLKHKST